VKRKKFETINHSPWQQNRTQGNTLNSYSSFTHKKRQRKSGLDNNDLFLYLHRHTYSRWPQQQGNKLSNISQASENKATRVEPRGHVLWGCDRGSNSVVGITDCARPSILICGGSILYPRVLCSSHHNLNHRRDTDCNVEKKTKKKGWHIVVE
jgi:hypothetical protein